MARLSMTDISHWYAAGSCLVAKDSVDMEYGEPPIVNWRGFGLSLPSFQFTPCSSLVGGYWHALADEWHH